LIEQRTILTLALTPSLALALESKSLALRVVALTPSLAARNMQKCIYAACILVLRSYVVTALFGPGHKLTQHRRADGTASQWANDSTNISRQTYTSDVRVGPRTHWLCPGA